MSIIDHQFIIMHICRKVNTHNLLQEKGPFSININFLIIAKKWRYPLIYQEIEVLGYILIYYVCIFILFKM